MIAIFSFTICAKSLSLLTITTSCPPDASFTASAASRSSLSTPSCSMPARPMARVSALIGSICWRSGSGIGLRCALYSASNATRSSDSPRSKNTSVASGFSRSISFHSDFTQPCRAPVGNPSARVSSGSA